ncbi:hypothetical protein AB6A40_008144 [Gnathostoma spinigerum]|uniref:Uncharacterized protein n=1 Tax=Gnathostoma spinigerum TaxID=75299 RepID=A0ABD6EYU2_9BILA
MSTSYHTCELLFRPNKRRLRLYLHISDRAVIYFFIAASYTPWFTLRSHGYIGLNLVWMLAVLGILYQYAFHERFKTLETLIYLIASCVPALLFVFESNWDGFGLMGLGGFVYLTGVFFFKLDGVIPFAHAIWHLFVVLGATLHMYAVYTCLLGQQQQNSLHK